MLSLSLLLVGSTTAFAKSIFLRALAPASALPGRWTYSNCYADNLNGRALRFASYRDGSGMSAASCIAFCDAAGYIAAGTEYTSECYCGTALPSVLAEDPSTCDMACSGNAAEVCGGPNRLTVYSRPASGGPEVNPGPIGWQSLGCYSDVVGARSLSITGRAPGYRLTVAECARACAGYQYFGVEYASECYCGQSILNGGASAPEGCNMPCSGNGSEWCGGPNRLNMYQVFVAPVADASPLGGKSSLLGNLNPGLISSPISNLGSGSTLNLVPNPVPGIAPILAPGIVVNPPSGKAINPASGTAFNPPPVGVAGQVSGAVINPPSVGMAGPISGGLVNSIPGIVPNPVSGIVSNPVPGVAVNPPSGIAINSAPGTAINLPPLGVVNPVSGSAVNPISGGVVNPVSGIASNLIPGIVSNPVSGIVSNPVSGVVSNPVSGIGVTSPSGANVNQANSGSGIVANPIAGAAINPVSGVVADPVKGLPAARASDVVANPILGAIASPILSIVNKPASSLVSNLVPGIPLNPPSGMVINPVPGVVGNSLSSAVTDPVSNLVSGSISNPIPNLASGPIVKPIAGPIASPIPGPLTNSIAGSIVNPISGPISNLVPGSLSNPVSGPVSNLVPGLNSGLVAGPNSNAISNVVPSLASSSLSNPATGPVSNLNTAPNPNLVPGPVSNIIPNPISNVITGPVSNSVSGPGLIPNVVSGPVPSSASGSLSNLVTGPIANVVPGLASNLVSKPNSNLASGSVSDPVSSFYQPLVPTWSPPTSGSLPDSNSWSLSNCLVNGRGPNVILGPVCNLASSAVNNLIPGYAPTIPTGAEISNGGFESGAASWTVSVNNVQANILRGVGVEGSYAFGIKPAASTRISQSVVIMSNTLAITPGRIHTLSFYAGRPSLIAPSSRSVMDVTVGPTSDGVEWLRRFQVCSGAECSLIGAGGSRWQRYTLDFYFETATQLPLTFTITFGGPTKDDGTDDVLIDGVSVSP